MSQRIFFDINILLDVLTQRQPFAADGAALWNLVEKQRIQGFASAMSLPTTYYLLRKASNHETAIEGVRLIRQSFEIVSLDSYVIDQALLAEFSDFEDGIQACAALHAKADYIVTRDPAGFRKSQVPVIDPATLVTTLKQANN